MDVSSEFCRMQSTCVCVCCISKVHNCCIRVLCNLCMLLQALAEDFCAGIMQEKVKEVRDKTIKVMLKKRLKIR